MTAKRLIDSQSSTRLLKKLNETRLKVTGRIQNLCVRGMGGGVVGSASWAGVDALVRCLLGNRVTLDANVNRMTES